MPFCLCALVAFVPKVETPLERNTVRFIPFRTPAKILSGLLLLCSLIMLRRPFQISDGCR